MRTEANRDQVMSVRCLNLSPALLLDLILQVPQTLSTFSFLEVVFVFVIVANTGAPRRDNVLDMLPPLPAGISFFATSVLIAPTVLPRVHVLQFRGQVHQLFHDHLSGLRIALETTALTNFSPRVANIPVDCSKHRQCLAYCGVTSHDGS